MCEEESDDTEAVAKLFEINDSIHRTLERYRLTKKGDIEGASRIPRGTLGTSGAGVKHGADNQLSLIDFGPEEDLDQAHPVRLATGAPSQPANSSVEDDLLGLSLHDGPLSKASSILGSGNAPLAHKFHIMFLGSHDLQSLIVCVAHRQRCCSYRNRKSLMEAAIVKDRVQLMIY